MAEPLPPFQAPPTPPELLAQQPPDQRFTDAHRAWNERDVRWVEALIRELAKLWPRLRLTVNELLTKVTTLEGRTKDTYTFPIQGSLAVGPVALPLRAVAAATLTEIRADVVVPPEGDAIDIDCMKNGAFFAGLVIPAGGSSAALTVSVGVAKDDALQPILQAVGTSAAGEGLVVQFRAQ